MVFEMYKLEEKVFVDGMQQAHVFAAHFSLCTGQSADLALIDPVAMDITPVIGDFDTRRFEFVKVNSEHGFNHVADYFVFDSEYNPVHVISRGNAGHLIQDDKAIAAAFSAGHCELFKSWNNVLTETHRVSGAGAVSINSHSLLTGNCGNNFSSAVNNDGGVFKLVLDRMETNITITVNGMMNKSLAVRLDSANAVRRFYVDAEISVNRLNINLINGHAGTGSDGRNIANNSAFNNAIAGKQSTGGVVILTIETSRSAGLTRELARHREIQSECLCSVQASAFVPILTPDSCLLTPVSVPILSPDSCLLTPVSVPILTPDSCLLTPVFKNNNNNIFENITLRCANVST
jgi:hypothetical protein